MNFLFTATPLKFMLQSFWRDEAFSYLLASKSIPQIIILTVKDFNPPFYYIVLHYWLILFGHSEISLRLLSLVCFWGVIYVAYLFFRNVLKIGQYKSLFYLLFFLINPLLHYYAFEARMYTMLAFLATLSCYAFIQKKKGLYLVSTVIGLYTHYFMIFITAVQLIDYLMVKTKKIAWKSYFLPAFLSFFPWLIYVATNNKQWVNGFWIAGPELKTLPGLPAIIYTGYEPGLIPDPKIFLLSALIVLCLIGGLYINRRFRKLRRINFFFFLWAFVPSMLTLLISLYRPIFLPRYLIFSCVGLVMLIVSVIDRYPFLIKLAAIAILFFYTNQYAQLQIRYRTKADLKQRIKEIKRLAKPGDLLYVTHEYNFHPAQYYFDPKRVYIYGKTYDELPQYIGKILISPDQIATQLPRYPIKAFILKDDLTYDIQSAY